MSVYDPYASGSDHGLTAKKPPPSSTAWMVTVADLFSLLLTFFVLLYSMSAIQKDHWEAISDSLMQRVQVVDEQASTALPSDRSVMRANFVYARGLDYLYTVIEKRFDTTPEFSGVIVSRVDNRITLSLVSDGLFGKGSAQLSPGSEQTLRQVGLFLAGIGNRITIEGHTDPTPIQSAAFPSNWELSMARAVSVANSLRQAGYPYAIDVYGLGSSRYGELAELPAEQQEALARRVDIIVRETVAKY